MRKSNEHSIFASLRHKNYRYLWISNVLGRGGLWVQQTTLAWLVWKLSGSATIVGITAGLWTLPFLFIGPFSGVLADKIDRRRLLMVTTTLMAVIAVLFAVVVAMDWVQVWHAVLFSLLMGCGSAIFYARQPGAHRQYSATRGDAQCHCPERIGVQHQSRAWPCAGRNPHRHPGSGRELSAPGRTIPVSGRDSPADEDPLSRHGDKNRDLAPERSARGRALHLERQVALRPDHPELYSVVLRHSHYSVIAGIHRSRAALRSEHLRLSDGIVRHWRGSGDADTGLFARLDAQWLARHHLTSERNQLSDPAFSSQGPLGSPSCSSRSSVCR